MRPAGSEVEGLHLRALVLADGLCVKGIRFLEPGTRVSEIDVDGVRAVRLQVKTVKAVFFISFGVQ